MSLMSTIKEQFAAAVGRPRAIETEKMVVADGLLASMIRPGQGGVYFLPVDEIIRRKGWKIYKEMLHDDQVKSCLAFKKILIAGRTWEIKPGDQSDAAKKNAEFVTWCLGKIDLDQVFTETLSALEFGYSLGELVWTRDTYEGKQVVCLKKIAHRDPEQLYLEMDMHGNYTGVTQLSLGQNIHLDPNKTLLFTHAKRFGNLYGDSDLRGAYRSYWAKKFIINFWNVFLERMGSPMTLIKYPTGADDTLKNTLKQILTNLGSKTEVLVPEGVEVELIEAKRSGNADYSKALSFHNTSIARAIFMSTLFGTGGEDDSTRGSDSQSFLQLRILFKMADGISKQLAAELTKQVIKQLVELNFGEDAVMPVFVWQDYGQFEGMKIADEIRQLHAAGIIDMDQTDVNYVRSVLGLPLRGEEDEQDEVIRPEALPLTGQGAAQPPTPGQGNENAKKGEAVKKDGAAT